MEPMEPMEKVIQKSSKANSPSRNNMINISSKNQPHLNDEQLYNNEGFFTSESVYKIASVESGYYCSPSTVVASLQNRTGELKRMITKLRNCKRLKFGNPGSTLDFAGGAATLVKINHNKD
jgi:hypothetical protein